MSKHTPAKQDSVQHTAQVENAIACADAWMQALGIPAYSVLLEALERLVARCRYDGIPNDSLPAVQNAEAAIAKAKGGAA